MNPRTTADRPVKSRRTVRLSPQRIAQATEARGFLKRDVEYKADIAGATVAKAYSGRPISHSCARRIARVLGVALGSILVMDANEPTTGASA